MNSFGFITVRDCVNVPPPVDARCQDPAFASQNPDICYASPHLILKPSRALTCALGSIQFKAFLVTNGTEQDVTADSVFAVSNQSIAVIGAGSGNCTGLSQGEVTISATYETYSANSVLSVMGIAGDCCSNQTVAMLLMVDTSLSMSQTFSADYPTRLDYAKAAATRFISEVNTTKDLVGLLSFNDSGFDSLDIPTSDSATVEGLVSGIAQSQQKTEFYNALTEAIEQLNSASADLKVIVLLSDGEDTSSEGVADYVDTVNPASLLADFKDQGGIVICLGCRASNGGFALLSSFSTGGFFINAYPGNEPDSLGFLSGLKGYICAGNCTPDGDVLLASPSLDYTTFINWTVSDGSVDLIGPGMFDLLPGNGLYVDLAGSSAPNYGRMTSRIPVTLTSGHAYRLTVQLAGNQRVDLSPFSALVRVFRLAGSTEVHPRSAEYLRGAQKPNSYQLFTGCALSGIDVDFSFSSSAKRAK